MRLFNFFRLTWQSELSVKNVTSGDYGAYDCMAQNEMGHERYEIYLNVTSRPDPPSLLKILNVTYNSVNLTWTKGKWIHPLQFFRENPSKQLFTFSGFNGGFPQTFKIRYKRENAENYQYVDVHPANVTFYEVQDLKVDTKYSISIMAFNSIGPSPYTSPIMVGTKSKLLQPLINNYSISDLDFLIKAISDFRTR